MYGKRIRVLTIIHYNERLFNEESLKYKRREVIENGGRLANGHSHPLWLPTMRKLEEERGSDTREKPYVTFPREINCGRTES